MKKYFLTQLKNVKLLTKEKLSKLKGKTFYSDYTVGDKLLYFFTQKYIPAKKSDEIDTVRLKIEIVAERELDLVKRDFKFIEVRNNIPIFERRSKD